MSRLRILVVIAVAVGASLSACGGNSDQAKKELAQARATINTERDAANREAAQAKEEAAAARQELADTKDKVAEERARLDRLRSEISGARAAVQENTIPGTGTFEVGKDIQPGTYRADARSGCYWARLSSLNTSDIIDNNNSDGPVVVEIKPDDRAFETQDCADFHRAD